MNTDSRTSIDATTERTWPSTPGWLHPALAQRIQGFRQRQDTWLDARYLLDSTPPGPDAIHLDGNDYLHLTGHPEIVQAQVNVLRANAEFVIQSNIFLQSGHPMRLLEGRLAAYVQKEDVHLCQSGYAANLSLLQGIANEHTPVYLDSLAHMSLWEGVHAASASGRAFRHNDPGHLEKLVASHGPGIVVVDSVYSTNGALCPLEEIVNIAERHGCMLVVDESHSLGLYGPQGAGLCAQLGLTERVHFITASLAKAFAARAGMYTAPAFMRHFLISHTHPTIFSSCLLAHEVAGLSATLELLKVSDDSRARLHAAARRLRAKFLELGYPVHQGTEQIISLEAGIEAETMRLRDEFEKRGIYGAVFAKPATALNRSMLRFTLNSSLSDRELDRIERAAVEIAPILCPSEWPIARRVRSRGAGATG